MATTPIPEPDLKASIQAVRDWQDYLLGELEAVRVVLSELLRTAPAEFQSQSLGALQERLRWMKEADPKEDSPGTIAGFDSVLQELSTACLDIPQTPPH